MNMSRLCLQDYSSLVDCDFTHNNFVVLFGSAMNIYAINSLLVFLMVQKVDIVVLKTGYTRLRIHHLRRDIGNCVKKVQGCLEFQPKPCEVQRRQLILAIWRELPATILVGWNRRGQHCILSQPKLKWEAFQGDLDSHWSKRSTSIFRWPSGQHQHEDSEATNPKHLFRSNSRSTLIWSPNYIPWKMIYNV
jgi:hypothetical protein